MKLSEHFTQEEFEYSDTAKAKGLSNKMNNAQVKEAIHTCTYLLEPLRKLLNEKYKTYNGKAVKSVSIKITSGFRGPALNKAVKGSGTSQHCKAQAADLQATVVFKDGTKTNIPYNVLYSDIKAWVKAGKMPVDQCIEEKSGGATWVHVSLSNQLKDCRKQFLKYNGKTYTNIESEKGFLFFQRFLREQGIETIDSFIPLTGIDEENIMLMLNSSEKMNQIMDYYLSRIFQS